MENKEIEKLSISELTDLIQQLTLKLNEKNTFILQPKIKALTDLVNIKLREQELQQKEGSLEIEAEPPIINEIGELLAEQNRLIKEKGLTEEELKEIQHQAQTNINKRFSTYKEYCEHYGYKYDPTRTDLEERFKKGEL